MQTDAKSADVMTIEHRSLRRTSVDLLPVTCIVLVDLLKTRKGAMFANVKVRQRPINVGIDHNVECTVRMALRKTTMDVIFVSALKKRWIVRQGQFVGCSVDMASRKTVKAVTCVNVLSLSLRRLIVLQSQCA